MRRLARGWAAFCAFARLNGCEPARNLFEIEADEIPKTRLLAIMLDGKIVHDVLYELGDSKLVDLDEVGT